MNTRPVKRSRVRGVNLPSALWSILGTVTLTSIALLGIRSGVLLRRLRVDSIMQASRQKITAMIESETMRRRFRVRTWLLAVLLTLAVGYGIFSTLLDSAR